MFDATFVIIDFVFVYFKASAFEDKDFYDRIQFVQVSTVLKKVAEGESSKKPKSDK